MKKQINVVGAVIVENNKVFCAQRSQTMQLPLLWEFPGGKIEPGETPENALKRELMEELDCLIEVNQFINTTSYEYDFGVVHLSTYYCKVLNDTIHIKEHADFAWVDIEDLHTLNWAPADLPAIKQIQETKLIS